MKSQVIINGKMISIDKASNIVASLEKHSLTTGVLGSLRLHNAGKSGNMAREFFEVKKEISSNKLTGI